MAFNTRALPSVGGEKIIVLATASFIFVCLFSVCFHGTLLANDLIPGIGLLEASFGDRRCPHGTLLP